MNETQMYHRIVALLREKNVSFELFEHAHVHSSKDAALVRGTKLEEAAKAIVLETGSGTLVQCIVSGHRLIDLKKLKRILGEKNVALADPEKVFIATGCKIGSVPPFGTMFEPAMQVYVDQEVLSRGEIVFSAGSHHHSIRMKAIDWVSIIQPTVVDIGKDLTTKL